MNVSVLCKLMDMRNVIHTEKKLSRVTVTPTASDLAPVVYDIPFGMRLVVEDGDSVICGQALTEGYLSPQDVLRLNGLDAAYDYILREVQKVYRGEDVETNDKHIEVIARQMTRKVKVEDAGDTSLLSGAVVDILEVRAENEAIEARIAAGEETLRPATTSPVLLGITKASLLTESFLSAASFQETTKVLTEAAIRGKVDHLLGLKENVIIGKLIPAGTGLECYRDVEINDQEAPAEVYMPEAAVQVEPDVIVEEETDDTVPAEA